jgi:hypothetical protein
VGGNRIDHIEDRLHRSYIVGWRVSSSIKTDLVLDVLITVTEAPNIYPFATVNASPRSASKHL